MSKTRLARAWAGLWVVAGIGLTWSVDRLVVGGAVDGGVRVLVDASVLVAWTGLGLLGVLVLIAARDLIAVGREQRQLVADARSEIVRLDERVTAVRAGQDELQGRIEEVATAAAATGRDVGERVQRVENAVEQAALDDARSRAAGIARLDELLDRVRGADDRSRA